jgi:glucuronoarabinoxylan endo-1,4-beta-xylanase
LSETIKQGDKDVKRLKEENYEAYADHLIRYIEFMKQNGVNLYAISIQNEPDMEFIYWTPQEVVNFMKQCGSKIRQTGVKLMSPESCGMSPDYTDLVLNDAEAFAQTDIVAGHLYQGFIDLSSSYAKDRHDYICGLYPRLQGKTWWMTEHLFNDGESSENPDEWEFRDWTYCLNHLGKGMDILWLIMRSMQPV